MVAVDTRTRPNGGTSMSGTIERRGRVAVVTMTTNPVNAQNRAFFADLHDGRGRDGVEGEFLRRLGIAAACSRENRILVFDRVA
jgi:hypothetical protein